MDKSIYEKQNSAILVVISSNIILSFTLIWARDWFPNPITSTFCLALANLFVSIFYFSFKLKSLKICLPEKKQILLIVGWSICYSLNYFIFIAYPGILKLPHFIIAQSLAPMLSVFFSKRLQSGKKGIIESLFPILILISIAILEIKSGSKFIETIMQLSLFLVHSFLFFGSLSFARILAESSNKVPTVPYLCLLNSFFITICVFIFTNGSFPALGDNFVINVTIFSLVVSYGLFAIIYGFANCPPMYSAILKSGYVPISIFAHSLWFNTLPNPITIFLCVIYCLLLIPKDLLNSLILKTKPTTPQHPTPSAEEENAN